MHWSGRLDSMYPRRASRLMFHIDLTKNLDPLPASKKAATTAARFLLHKTFLDISLRKITHYIF